MQHRSYLLAALICTLSMSFASGQGKDQPKWAPSPHIAATDPLRPEQQLKKMKVPPGFEIQLVAADPDIRKPINIAFDAAGRLWLTETIEYPFMAKEGQGRDAVKILEDFGPDGKARKITTFADKLNIPIGVIPDTDAKGALVYSIPSIFHMRDTKGAGKADQREVYYTEFGHEDTHGMTGEFQRGFDGWIYACHGFRNTSKVKSKNGETGISMTSGNTYRIKPDGSRIEKFTTGQVNPFGLAFDPYGNLYSGDCHSRPLTMLLRGAWYESFARPHDGLGFAPHMNTFKDHSTALCGVTYYEADQFPAAFRGKLFLGDVVLNRVNAYGLEWNGVSPKAIMESFITSQDPWFRPVDIKLGPDGCLYIADFYNRVIGHYELDLNHPARDREKGRIWRVVYRGKPGDPTGFTGKLQPRPVTNLLTADVLKLVEMLGNTNITVRMHAADQLVERGGNEAAAALQPIVKDVAEAGKGPQKAHALWVLERLSKLDDDTLARATSAKEKEVRVHVQRILTERKAWTPKYAAMAKLGLADKDAFVQRVAVESLAAHPRTEQLDALLTLREAVPAGDTHLLYAVRLAIAEHLRRDESWAYFRESSLTDFQRRAIADVLPGVRNVKASEWLMENLPDLKESNERTRDLLRHVVRHGADNAFGWGVDFILKRYADRGTQGALLKAIVQANQERGGKIHAIDQEKCEQTVIALLDSKQSDEQQTGAELAGALKLARAQPKLLAIVAQASVPEPVRKSCITTLVSIDAKQAIGPLGLMLLNEKEPIAIREQVANALAGTNHADAHAALVQALQNAPARLQSTIALGMAGSQQGGDRLLAAIEAGKASPRLLQDRAIELRLQSAKIANINNRLKKLTEGLPPTDQKAAEVIAKKRDAFVSFKADPVMGQKVFAKQCAACHQVATQGGKIGPQLDGIGVRGLERLLEDIVDPNRNIDQAFRTTQIVTKNGQSVSGLYLRDEGNVVILGDKDGKEVRVEKTMIDERNIIPLSPMPSNFAESIGEADFHHLMAYLLAQKGKQ
jgi:putative heme-binding domain-containing protein